MKTKENQKDQKNTEQKDKNILEVTDSVQVAKTTEEQKEETLQKETKALTENSMKAVSKKESEETEEEKTDHIVEAALAKNNMDDVKLNQPATKEESVAKDKKDKNKNVREYVAFISYRHKELDKEVAKKVHRMIERYTVPKELRAQWGGKKLGKVFRDEEELPVSSNLTDSIQTALDHTKFLIVICTPNTPESIWVEREISYFLEHHDRQHVVAVLVDGTPDESFPALLTTIYDKDGKTPIGSVEPLAANLTGTDHRYVKSRIRREAVRLYAAIMGCPFDSLWQREKRYRLRCAVALLSLVLVVALSFSVSIYAKNREISARNKQIEEQSEQIKQQYAEIQEKNTELSISESDALLQQSLLLYDTGDLSDAVKKALRAIASTSGMERNGASVEALLYKALGAGLYNNTLRTVNAIEQEDEIGQLMVSDDGERLYTFDSIGIVRCYDTDNGKLIWKGASGSNSLHFYVTERDRMFELKEQGVLVCFNNDRISALSLEDGHMVWERVMGQVTYCMPDCATLYDNNTKIAAIQNTGKYDANNELVILDTVTGEELQIIELPAEIRTIDIASNGRKVMDASEDGKYLIGTTYIEGGLMTYSGYYLFMVDLENGTSKVLEYRDIASGFKVKPFVIGVTYVPENKSVVEVYYDTDKECVTIKQIFTDGRVGAVQDTALFLPNAEVVDKYDATYVDDAGNGVILASCNEIEFIINEYEGTLIYSEKLAEAHVLEAQWINAEKYCRNFLTNDGVQHAFYENAGIAIGKFSDKIHIARLAITKNYAFNNGGNGQYIKPETTQAVILDDDPRKVYIQKPEKDEQMKKAEWFEGADARNYTVIKNADETHLISAVSSKDDTVITVSLIDAVTQKVEAQYKIEADDTKEMPNFNDVREAFFSKDAKQLWYDMNIHNPLRYDLVTGETTPIFGTRKIYESSYVLNNEKNIIIAGICEAEDDINSRTVCYCVGDQEMVDVEMPNTRWFEGNTLQGTDPIKVGKNGYIVVTMYKDSENVQLEGYLAVDTATGKQYNIQDELQGDATKKMDVGQKEPYFAVLDEDRSVRVYDIISGAMKKQIHLDYDMDEIDSLAFCNQDQNLAIWTVSRRLLVYDLESGAEVMDETYESSQKAAASDFTSGFCVTDDPERDRTYFNLQDGAAMCVNTKKWIKTSDFVGFNAFCSGTNQIYRLKNNSISFGEEDEDILYYTAYTLEDLVARAKEMK